MRTVLAAVALAVLAANATAGELQYEIPPGWIDLAHDGDLPGVPKFLADEARSGKYRHFLADPERITERGAAVSLNIVESAKPLAVNRNTIRFIAAETIGSLNGMGADAGLIGDIEIVKIGSVPAGRYSYIAQFPAGAVRQDQYVISGRRSSAVLTFTCPPDLYDRYAPLFERTALATRGAWAPWSAGKRVAVFAFAGAAGGLVVAGIIVLLARRRRRALSPARGQALRR
jgi:hypothetical protein